MALLKIIQNIFGFGTASQPDWRESVERCLGGSEAVCEYVPIASSAKLGVFVGPARPLSSGALIKAASILGVPVATISAVKDIEALGSSYLASGRPKILYEAHIFSRLTAHKYDKSNPAISSKSWNSKLYGAGGENQFKRLEQARKLNEEAALKSASWGAFQILGLNHSACGFKSVHDFIYAVMQSEDNNLYAFCTFVKANPKMHQALKSKDWAGFAYRYNGPGYKKNAYHTKLAAAYKKHGGR